MKELLTQLTWKQALKDEYTKPYMQELTNFLELEIKAGKTIFPPEEQWFLALNTTSLANVKVVILGQDPYPTVGHAHGLCFSVRPEIKRLPKSLQNINKELLDDCHINNNHTGYLLPWAEQGVLLLNAVLTVEEGNVNSHQGKGWENFTDKIIEIINRECEHVVFILWGAYAQKKGKYIDSIKHLIINDPHPSPLSAYRGFWGSSPFSRVNEYLIRKGKEPIDWQLENKQTLF